MTGSHFPLYHLHAEYLLTTGPPVRMVNRPDQDTVTVGFTNKMQVHVPVYPGEDDHASFQGVPSMERFNCYLFPVTDMRGHAVPVGPERYCFPAFQPVSYHIQVCHSVVDSFPLGSGAEVADRMVFLGVTSLHVAACDIRCIRSTSDSLRTCIQRTSEDVPGGMVPQSNKTCIPVRSTSNY